MESKTGRNYCLDFVKGIACLFIVLMHVRFPASWRTLALSVTRFAVPFFFMVSGYYTFNPQKESFEDVKKKVRHIVKIVFYASVFYLAFAAVQIALGGETLHIHFTKYFDHTFSAAGPLKLKSELNLSVGSMKALLLFNLPAIIVPQMWFLFALLYVYLIYGLVYKWTKKTAFYLIVPSLWGGYILLAQIAYALGYSVSTSNYRNWLFLGIPFFFAGRYIHEHQDALKIPNKILMAIVILSTILCPVEMALFGRVFGVHLCSFPQVLALFLLAVNNPGAYQGSVLQKIGTKYSMFIYILHLFVWHTMEYVYDFLGLSDNIVAQYAMPIVVIILTILLSMLCYHAQNKLDRRKSYA